VPELTIPLYQPPGLRPFRGLLDHNDSDSRISAAFVEVISDGISQNTAPFVVKRSGLFAFETPAVGVEGTGILSSQTSASAIVSAFGNTTSTVYSTTTSGVITTLGVLTGRCLHISEALVGTINHILITSSDQTGWYWASDALASFTGDTHTNTVIDNIASTASLYVGQLLTGTGIQAGTRIAAITSATAITVSIATTATNAGVTITSTRLAKIISANFPTDIVGQITSLDGFFFVMTTRGRIYQSAVNNISSWSASDWIATNVQSDNGVGCIRYKDMIAGFGTNSCELFKNGGNSFGSVLVRVGAIEDCGALGRTGSKSAIASGFDTVFFLDTNGNLFMLEGAIAKKLTQWPDILPTDSVSSAPEISTFNYLGLRVVNIGFPNINFATAFQKWFFLDYDFFTTPGFTTRTFISSGSNPDVDSAVYAVDIGTSGKIFNMRMTGGVSFQDNGVAYSMVIQTQPYYLNEGLPFFIDDIDLIADTQPNGSTLLESTADDYANWVTIGSFSLTQQQKRLPGGGYYDSSVAFRLTDSGNNAWRGQALKVTWRPA
jgi:hypothetical protein